MHAHDVTYYDPCLNWHELALMVVSGVRSRLGLNKCNDYQIAAHVVAFQNKAQDDPQHDAKPIAPWNSLYSLVGFALGFRVEQSCIDVVVSIDMIMYFSIVVCHHKLWNL